MNSPALNVCWLFTRSCDPTNYQISNGQHKIHVDVFVLQQKSLDLSTIYAFRWVYVFCGFLIKLWDDRTMCFSRIFFFFLVLFRECKRRRNIFVFVCLLFLCTRMFTFCTTKNWLSIHLNLHQMYFVWYVVIYHLYQWNQIKPKI